MNERKRSDTPICDFLNEYAAGDRIRAHMPGHKGKDISGCERFDITETDGADELFKPDGIIAESEKNASGVFSCPTFYSTEGSSLCIRAMLYLALVCRTRESKTVIAARNVHKTFVFAAAMLDLNVTWVYPEQSRGVVSSLISPNDVEKALLSEKEKPLCVYVTSPDYTGVISDIAGISRVCHSYGVPLLVDNAHGAYLNFLTPSVHPIRLGADMCCDSAHKTLPVLTGGAYLHIAPGACGEYVKRAKQAMAVFASTSPSYLILRSLDSANAYLKDHAKRLRSFIPHVDKLKAALANTGYALYGDEPLKVTLMPKQYGSTGDELAEILTENGVFAEFHDSDFLVMMFTPENGETELETVGDILTSVPVKAPILHRAPPLPPAVRALPLREALLSKSRIMPVERCEGMICADTVISCPPAVPLLISGEVITKEAIECFKYYGTAMCCVVEA